RDVPMGLEPLAAQQLAHPRLRLGAQLLALSGVRSGDARVVDEDVEAAHLPFDLGEHRLDLPAVGDVGLDGAAARLPRAERLQRLVRRVQPDVVHDDARPLFGEDLRDGTSDTGSRTRYERDLISELHGYLPTPAVSSTWASSRKCGMTSRANSSIISSVFSCVPPFIPEQTMPACSSSEKIRSLSRTVAGLPTMMYPPSSSSSKLRSVGGLGRFVRARRKDGSVT